MNRYISLQEARSKIEPVRRILGILTVCCFLLGKSVIAGEAGTGKGVGESAKNAAVDEHAGRGHKTHNEPKGHDERDDDKAPTGHDEHDDGDDKAPKGHDEHDDDKAPTGHDGHDDDKAPKGHDEHDDDKAPKGHDEHEGHGDSKDQEEGEGDDAHAGHSDEEAGLVLSADELRNAGIAVSEAASGELRTEISMSGEVVLNEDAVVHVVSLVPGVVREVGKSNGDSVALGELLAVLDSVELGESKLDYLTKANELGCCAILVPRAEAIRDNTLRLVKLLDGNPSLDALHSFDAGHTGENLGLLVSSYAELADATQTFDREKSLFEKKVGSEQDYLSAQNVLKKARAEYLALRDRITFDVERDLAEAKAEQRNAEFEVTTAKRQLLLVGVSEAEVDTLDVLVEPPHENDCPDPNCEGCKARSRNADATAPRIAPTFSQYRLHSPASGVVIDKHMSRGEKVGDDTEIFTIADMNTVWVRLSVHLRDIDALVVGQEVMIEAEHSGRRIKGTIDRISPTVSEITRTGTVLIVIDNAGGYWRPGMFVVGHVSISAEAVSVVVPRDVVQIIEKETVVFVPKGKGFSPVVVKTGRSDRTHIEILSGLAPGARYVSQGAFEIKAKLVTSNLDPHAGHGH